MEGADVVDGFIVSATLLIVVSVLLADAGALCGAVATTFRDRS